MAEATPVAPKVKKATKPKKVASHPPYSSMIQEAITSLKERGGSSRQAILKFICKTYKVSADDKVAVAQLRLSLKRGVASGVLKQSKGTGASGSFKLGAVKKAEKKPKVKKSVKKTVKKPKSPKKKTVKPKKAAEKKKPKAKKTVKPKKAKSPKKATKSPKKAVKKPAAKKPVKAKKAKTPKKAAKK